MDFNRLIPELSVSDYKESLNFYVNLLGFSVAYVREEERFALISLQGAQLMLEERNYHWETGELEHPYGRGMNLQIEVDQIAPLVEKLRRKGYPLFRDVREKWYAVKDVFWGSREFLVQDPDGYLLRFAEDVGVKTSSEMP
jgi:catechol 2,3-dioxygenase-like lactoylglutathione lyase family enzyme